MQVRVTVRSAQRVSFAMTDSAAAHSGAESPAVVPYAGLSPTEFARWEATARAVAADLAATAVARDRANKDPHEEIGLLRRAGLLGLAVPRAFGGQGANLTQALQVARIISAADGSIGQLIAYHYSNGVWTYILGTRAQWEETARGVAAKGWFQGGVSNPRDQWSEVLHAEDGRTYLNGTRTFATGTAVAQVITATFWDNGRRVHYQLPPDRAGLTAASDWDNLGQRLTASGSVRFDNVVVGEHERLSGLERFGGDADLRDGLRTLFSQLIFINLYLGIAEGALHAAADYVRNNSRAWPESGLERAVDDPYHLVQFGRWSAGISAGVALADKAAGLYQQALEAGEALDAGTWGRLAVIIDEAKVIATDVSLAVTANIYEAMGARATANRYGFDLYWRNARTHTVHDPVSYRAREIGSAVLTGELPRPRVIAEPPRQPAAAVAAE